MKTYSPAVNAAIASGSLALVQLVYLGFATKILLNTSTWNLPFGGDIYLGASGLGTISPINDQPGEMQGITLEMAGIDSNAVALALDDAGVVQGTLCVIRTAIIETVNYTILDAPIEWTGYLDTMSLSEDGTTAAIRVTAESRGVDLLRGSPLFYSDTDQLTINATDRAFKYVVDQIDKPITWPARGFYYQ